MKSFRRSDMVRLDRLALRHYGIPTLLLMDQAGYHVALAVQGSHSGKKHQTIHVLTGGGQNGGDGISAARWLSHWGHTVTVLWLKDPKEMEDNAKALVRMAERRGVTFKSFISIPAQQRLPYLRRASILVDALLGTGFHGRLRMEMVDAIVSANASGRPIIAIDLPSGLNPDNGQIMDVAIRARKTVVLAALKRGLLARTAKKHVGKMMIADIGLPLD